MTASLTRRASEAVAASPMTQQAEDERFMRLALALGRRHLGRAAPNPSVGAVVVRQGTAGPVVIATGVTAAGGRPHAERIALDSAGQEARGATLYVSLEPCSHHGHTTPCADAIVSAGIGRVVTALVDPDPRVSGKGHGRLRDAGIAVTTNVLARDARLLHRGHIMRVTEGRPLVTVKLARTADGFAARDDGGRLKITGRLADRKVHLMRAHADAIMIGAGTAVADDPQLTVRLPGLENLSPVRVVVDSDLGFSRFAHRLIQTAREIPVWVLTTASMAPDQRDRLTQAGVQLIECPADAVGRVDLAVGLRRLAERGVTRVFCEGGPGLADALASAGLLDELVLITASHALGTAGTPAVGHALEGWMEGAQRAETAMAGPDRFERFEEIG